MENLWGSVFTPGTTPTLLLATNATFGLLQLTLAGLLAATYSIHFVILSVLCAGLWWSINWFATELQAAQQKEEEAERIRKAKQRETGSSAESPESKGGWKSSGEVADSANDEGIDTETEMEGDAQRQRMEYKPAKKDEEIRQGVIDSLKKSGAATAGGASTGLGVHATGARQRATEGDLSGEISTDSEWEKVEGEK